MSQTNSNTIFRKTLILIPSSLPWGKSFNIYYKNVYKVYLLVQILRVSNFRLLLKKDKSNKESCHVRHGNFGRKLAKRLH